LNLKVEFEGILTKSFLILHYKTINNDVQYHQSWFSLIFKNLEINQFWGIFYTNHPKKSPDLKVEFEGILTKSFLIPHYKTINNDVQYHQSWFSSIFKI
jgi:hypothetical protein